MRRCLVILEVNFVINSDERQVLASSGEHIKEILIHLGTTCEEFGLIGGRAQSVEP